MAQNIYDDPKFFEGYKGLRRQVEGLGGAPEWPAVRALLPPMAGLRVVDLACGFGWFARWARGEGAASVLALDLSQNMLDRARADTEDAAIDYRQADLEQLTLPPGAFDLAYSSLALHYLEDLGRLARTVHGALTSGGRFVFTMEHPIFMASQRAAWIEGPGGARTWPVDGYFREGPRVTNWLTHGVVKQHHTMATTLNALIDAGFSIRRVEEWRPTDAQIEAWPDLAAELERPMILAVSAER